MSVSWFYDTMPDHSQGGRRAACRVDFSMSLREHLDRKMGGIMRKNLDLGASQFSITTYLSSVSRKQPSRAQLKFRGVRGGTPLAAL